jgi:hypothetical protein
MHGIGEVVDDEPREEPRHPRKPREEPRQCEMHDIGEVVETRGEVEVEPL